MSDEQATTETTATHGALGAHTDERTAAPSAPATLGSVANPRRTRR